MGKTIHDVFSVVVHTLILSPEVPVVPVGDDDVPEVVLDPRETEEILGWKARVGFEETIYRMLSWYDEHGVSAIHSHLAEPKKLIKESIKLWTEILLKIRRY